MKIRLDHVQQAGTVFRPVPAPLPAPVVANDVYPVSAALSLPAVLELLTCAEKILLEREVDPFQHAHADPEIQAGIVLHKGPFAISLVPLELGAAASDPSAFSAESGAQLVPLRYVF